MNGTYIVEPTDRFPTCHAGTICELPNGDLLAAWYTGQREGSPDSVICGSRLSAGSSLWGQPEIWVNVADHAAGNPRLFVGPDQAVWLISPINYGVWCDGGTRMFFKRSYDLGRSWTDLEILTQRRRILGKNKPLYIQPDILILPMEYEGIGDIAFLRSTNAGKTWNTIEVSSGGAYLDQPTLVQLSNGDLLAYMRSWEGAIYETHSHDAGLTWGVPTSTSLPNNNSGIDMVRLASGKLVLAYNPTALGRAGKLTSEDVYGVGVASRFAHKALRKAGIQELQRMISKTAPKSELHESGLLTWGPRTPLCLAVSGNEGHSWQKRVTLEDAEGEYSYPAIIQAKDGAVHIIYTHNRTRMRHVRLEENEI
jgi:predicted neuraminidase